MRKQVTLLAAIGWGMSILIAITSAYPLVVWSLELVAMVVFFGIIGLLQEGD